MMDKPAVLELIDAAVRTLNAHLPVEKTEQLLLETLRRLKGQVDVTPAQRKIQELQRSVRVLCNDATGAGFVRGHVVDFIRGDLQALRVMIEEMPAEGCTA